MNIDPKGIKTILIVNLGGLGDILLSTPAIRAIKARYASARMWFLTIPRSAELVEELPYVDRVFKFDTGGGGLAALRNIMTLLLLRRSGIDLAVNMRTMVSVKGAAKIKALFGMIKPRVSAGRDTDGRGSFFDIRVPEPSVGNKYEMEYDIEMARALGAETTDRKIDFVVGEKESARVGALLGAEGVKKDDLIIGIHPGGAPSHRWNAGNFRKVMDAIGQKHKCKFIITGTRDEKGLLGRFVNLKNADIIDMTGKLNFAELGALIKRCRLYISNDTAPMHIAAIVGTPLVAIFGPGYIHRFDPRAISPGAAVLYKEADCAPCGRTACPDMRCLEAIKPEEVISEALKLLDVSV